MQNVHDHLTPGNHDKSVENHQRKGATSRDTTTSSFRLYKQDKEVVRLLVRKLKKVVDLSAVEAGPTLRRRERLYQRAYLAFLIDRCQRSIDWVWLEHMEGTISPRAFRRRVEADGWIRLRRELNARIAAGMLQRLDGDGDLDQVKFDYRTFTQIKMPEPDQPMPEICAKTRAVWRRLVGEMGPQLVVVPKSNARTRRSMERWSVAEFMEGAPFVVGRLTPLGVSLRDRWHRADCWRKWEQRKAAGLTKECGGRNKCHKLQKPRVH